MAEAFAKAYGGDIIEAASAGVSPAPDIAPLTHHIVRQKNFSMDGHFPKGLETITHKPADLIVNMSGIPLSAGSARERSPGKCRIRSARMKPYFAGSPTRSSSW